MQNAVCIKKGSVKRRMRKLITRQGTPKGVDERVDFFALWQRDCEMELDLGLFSFSFPPSKVLVFFLCCLYCS
jgi:hypothetical protein